MFRFMFHWGNKHKRPGGIVADRRHKTVVGCSNNHKVPELYLANDNFWGEYQELDLKLAIIKPSLTMIKASFPCIDRHRSQ